MDLERQNSGDSQAASGRLQMCACDGLGGSDLWLPKEPGVYLEFFLCGDSRTGTYLGAMLSLLGRFGGFSLKTGCEVPRVAMA